MLQFYDRHVLCHNMNGWYFFKGAFIERAIIGGAVVEQRTFAHRAITPLLITQITVDFTQSGILRIAYGYTLNNTNAIHCARKLTNFNSRIRLCVPDFVGQSWPC